MRRAGENREPEAHWQGEKPAFHGISVPTPRKSLSEQKQKKQTNSFAVRGGFVKNI